MSSPPGLEPLLPLDVRPHFQGLHRELIALLRGLALEDWGRATIAGAWRVFSKALSAEAASAIRREGRPAARPRVSLRLRGDGLLESALLTEVEP